MFCKAFKFGRVSSSQFDKKQLEVTQFLASVDVIGLPQVTACDEDGPVMFVFYNNKQAEISSEAKSISAPKSKKD